MSHTNRTSKLKRNSGVNFLEKQGRAYILIHDNTWVAGTYTPTIGRHSIHATDPLIGRGKAIVGLI
jgi:hypothetical protein